MGKRAFIDTNIIKKTMTKLRNLNLIFPSLQSEINKLMGFIFFSIKNFIQED